MQHDNGYSILTLLAPHGKYLEIRFEKMQKHRVFSSRRYVSFLPTPAGRNDTTCEDEGGDTVITAVPYGPKQQLWSDIPLPPSSKARQPRQANTLSDLIFPLHHKNAIND